MGKPVIPPDELFSHMDDYCVIMAVTEAYNEVKAILAEHNFPQDQIIPLLRRDPGIPEYEIDHQYFEFPSLFRHNTAFIDGGSLDCRSSYLFAQWCGGEYSHIYAFEPDPISFDICEANLEKRPVRGLKLVQAGLSDRSGEVRFRSGLYNQSCIVSDAGSDDDGIVVVPLTTIDSTVGGDTVGFIKMDIEGAEFAALKGAEQTIRRDKPLLALSVYHRPGDVVAIIDYLHSLIPEYKFWLRHYSMGFSDTVLYASVDEVR